MIFVNGFIFGFITGVFVLGIVAPWLVADTHMKLEDELREMEYEEESK